jgi:hypothetical protein
MDMSYEEMFSKALLVRIKMGSQIPETLAKATAKWEEDFQKEELLDESLLLAAGM